MHLLDTDTLTHLHADHPKVVERLRALDDPDVGTTIITKIELLRGRMDFLQKATTGAELLRARQLLVRTEKLLEQIVIVPFDTAAAAQFDQMSSATAHPLMPITASNGVSLSLSTGKPNVLLNSAR